MPLPAILSDTTAADLQRLIDEREVEGPHLEFKREAPRPDGQGRHELAADVSAMANSGGGDFVFGMDEAEGGVAGAMVPFTGNADQERQRVLQSLAASVEPRLPGLEMHAVQVDQGAVFVLRVPQSWAGPHRVSTNHRFFIRVGAGRRELDIPEIRSMFLRTESQAQKVRDFRANRLGLLLSDEAPVRLVPGTIQVLHLIPTAAALGLMSVDPAQYMDRRVLPWLGMGGANPRINIDGALSVRAVGQQGTHGYSQFFRNGYFEAVKVETWGGAEQRTALDSDHNEQLIMRLVEQVREELIRLGISAEMTAMWSLLGAERAELGVNRNRFDIEGHVGRFDRRTLVVPDVLLRAEQPVEQALRPLFDQIWQAAGFVHCFNYNAQGDWVSHR